MTITALDKKLYRIDVRREMSAVLYVLAEDLEAAQEDAEELIFGIQEGEWDGPDDDVDIAEARREPTRPETLVWTGGPEGSDKPWSELRGG